MRDIRESIEIVGARQNNLKGISVEIPRDKLTVITGVSGSGKSSLAFGIVYGEAQRRFLKSLSNFAKSRIGQVKKPDVDFVRGLSPVIAIEQKKGNNNPRSTVGTVTDVNDYLRLLFAEAGTGACPVCGHPLEPVDAARLAERIGKLPEGTEVAILTPAHKVYGEDYAFLFGKIRDRGYKHLLIDGEPFSLSEKDQELDEGRDYRIEIVLERLAASEAAYLQTAKSIEALMASMEDDLLWRIHAPGVGEAFFREMGCAAHGYLLCETHPHHFSFNVSGSACDTCSGVGTSHTAEPRFMVASPQKSILRGGRCTPRSSTRTRTVGARCCCTASRRNMAFRWIRRFTSTRRRCSTCCSTARKPRRSS